MPHELVDQLQALGKVALWFVAYNVIALSLSVVLLVVALWPRRRAERRAAEGRTAAAGVDLARSKQAGEPQVASRARRSDLAAVDRQGDLALSLPRA